MPVSANPTREVDVDFQMLNVNLVLREMEYGRTRLNLLILDACRSNPFGGRGLRAVNAGLAQMQAPEGTLISFATQPGNVAQDGTGGDSPFSKALAQTMRKPGLDIFRAFNEVGLLVSRATGGERGDRSVCMTLCNAGFNGVCRKMGVGRNSGRAPP